MKHHDRRCHFSTSGTAARLIDTLTSKPSAVPIANVSVYEDDSQFESPQRETWDALN